jgi:murein DD-endopeptidase MepM/ murein hydrolase activator NlpD
MLERFPLPASAAYSYAQRFSASHRGTDIMAPSGTMVVAVESGKAWPALDAKGGRVVYLEAPSKRLLGAPRRYYYAHLLGWDAPIESATAANPRSVEAGELLGYVGNTGNAKDGPPHLHFQVRQGSLVIDPFDLLQDVDPHRERGSRSSSALPSAVLLVMLVWLASRSLK